jgi:hypothetical protein
VSKVHSKKREAMYSFSSIVAILGWRVEMKEKV